MFKIIGADQKEYGPISVAQIRQWISDGRLNAQTQAQREGSGDWQPLATFDEFADIFNPSASTSSPAYAPAPMAAPASAPMDPASREMALRDIKGPAIALIVIASIGVALYLLSVLLHLMGFHRELPPNIPPEWRPMLERMLQSNQGTSGMLLALMSLAVNGFVLLGALKMLRLESHSLAFAACIVALLPCSCCCFFGIPFGIWGLIVMNKPEVKSQFS
jgi:hypothetical protein